MSANIIADYFWTWSCFLFGALASAHTTQNPRNGSAIIFSSVKIFQLQLLFPSSGIQNGIPARKKV